MQIRRLRPNPAIRVESLSFQVKNPQDTPANILEEIVWHKETEVAQLRESIPLIDLQRRVQASSPCKDFLAALQQSRFQPAVIAEVKKASPSKGVLREDFDAIAIAQRYEQGGAACLSVLTDSQFFQGSFENLAKVRASVELPLLCKEFVIHAYQIYLARSYGADAVLLIAAILSDKDLQYFVKIVKALGMTALIEVHTLEELDRVLALDGVQLIGINNRNLEDFTVSLQTTVDLLQQRQESLKARNIQIVSESGLHTPDDLRYVHTAGANAVLIGESLVTKPDPGLALAALTGAELAAVQ
jgi:indole-3-glycerol phosphate synthase